MNTTIVVAQREKPLSPLARIGVIVALAVLTLTLYLFCLLALPLLGALFLLAVVAILPLARFGAGGFMFPAIRRLWRTARVVVNCVRLEKGARHHLTLTETDAPHLFRTVRECARRVGCLEPNSIVLEMTCGAWVLLEGVRAGHGKCTLGIGYELLATLTQEELEAVLLHEMAHALRVQRGLSNWTRAGIARWVKLAETMDALEREERPGSDRSEGWSSFWTGRVFSWLSNGLAKTGVKLYAAYSRQDEFEADRTSAELCGGSTFGDALLKTAIVGEKSSKVHWLDCVMQSQREGSYTQWLRGKLLPESEEETARLGKEAIASDRRSPFSFHPTMDDRLAYVQAFEGARSVREAGSIAIAAEQSTGGAEAVVPWLADMDAQAEKLFAHIERVEAEEERKESEALSRWERKRRRGKRPVTEQIGWALSVPGVIFLAFSLVPTEDRVILFLVGAVCLVGGQITIRFIKPRPPALMAVPDYTLWEEALEAIWQRGETPRQIAPYPRPTVPDPVGSRKDERLHYWAENGYERLRSCDFQGALACGLRCLEVHHANGEGLLLVGLTYNCLGYEEEGDRRLVQAMQTFQRHPSVQWATGWACLATSNWTAAEAYLLSVTERLPAEPTLWGALALAQGRRGKTRQATANLRRAVSLAPDSSRLRLRLAQSLLMAGKAREAQPELEALARFPETRANHEVGLSWVRLHLQLNHKEAADAQAQIVSAEHPEPETFYRLGVSYAMTDHLDDASGHFHRATAFMLYPAAWVHLAAIHAQAERKAEARACYLGALNLLHTVAPKADKPLDVLSSALNGLRALRDTAPTLFLWEVTLTTRSLPAFTLQELHLLVLAPNRNGAIGYANELYQAMHPGGPPIEQILARAEKSDMEPPDEGTQPGIVDWRGRR